MKEHQSSNSLSRANSHPSLASAVLQDQSFAKESACKAADQTPCIIVRGFSDLSHFLSWFQIDVQQPLIFPSNQDRYIKQDHDCITICGYENLEEFLVSFAPDGNRRPSVPLVNIKAFAK